MKLLLTLLTALLLAGCAAISIGKYELTTGEISPHKDGSLATLPLDDDPIEKIDATHYKTCSGFKWPGATLFLFPIPLPLKLPIGRKCTHYAMHSSGKIAFADDVEIETSYCCGICPIGPKSPNMQFFGCGKW